MNAPPPPARLLRLLLTAATFSPPRHHHQTWRWCGLPPYATSTSRRQSRAACVTIQAPFTACSLWYDHNPIAVCLLRESPCFAGRSPEHEHCSGKKIAVNVVHPARLRRPLTNDVPEHCFCFCFCFFFSFPTLLSYTVY